MLGVLRSVWEGEDPLQLAIHGSSIRPWERLAVAGKGGQESFPAAVLGAGVGSEEDQEQRRESDRPTLETTSAGRGGGGWADLS